MDLNALRRLAGIQTVTPTEVTSDDSNILRKLAGMPALPVKTAEAKDEPEEMPVEEPEEMPAEELPAIVSSIAAEAEGKTGDELAQLIKQVYDAGVADGISQATPVEEASKPVAPSGQQQDTEVCPSCSSAQVKTHSDGEKECHDCHKTWNVQGMKEDAKPINPSVAANAIKRELVMGDLSAARSLTHEYSDLLGDEFPFQSFMVSLQHAEQMLATKPEVATSHEKHALGILNNYINRVQQKTKGVAESEKKTVAFDLLKHVAK